MKTLTRLFLAAALAAGVLGCDRHFHDRDGGDFEFEFYIAGHWSGSIEDSRCGHGEVTFEFFQSGSTISGSWYILFSGRTTDGCYDPDARDGRLSGPLTGHLSGNGLTLTMQRAQGSAGCAFTQPITLSGTWTSSRLSGTYGGVSCSGSVAGTIEASR